VYHLASCQLRQVTARPGRSCILLSVSHYLLPEAFLKQDRRDVFPSSSSSSPREIKLTHHLTMAAAVEYRSHNRARIFYTPSPTPPAPQLQRPIRTLSNLDFFRPRRTPAGRIRIKALSASTPSDDCPKYRSASPKRSSSFKLAVSRESAKRFLRSVIQSQNDSSRDKTQTKLQSKKNRQSWSPASSTPRTVDIEPDNMRGAIRGSISGPVSGMVSRPRLNSDVRHATNRSSGSENSSISMAVSPQLNANGTLGNGVIPVNIEEEKPLAAGNGVSVGVHLAEPVLFLQGFENSEAVPGNTAMLRGSLHVRVQKSAKIKAISLRFRGKAVTKWPEGIPPKKSEFEETNIIMNHTWPFFNAQFDSAETSTGADHVQLAKGPDSASTGAARLDPLGRASPNISALNLTSKDAKRLSLQVNQSRSFGKGENPSNGPSVATKGYRTFLPGDYLYNFELPIDSRLPESIDVDLGSVKYELEATVERSGAFRANLAGTKEVTLIRAPSEGSLEQVEPIAISRNWEDQLHYDIVISGKSFPLGSQVPIAFKLTPLAKVQCHRIKVLVTENIEYFCSNKHVHRMEPTKKVQLFEKRSDSDPTSTFPGSTMRITAGGGIPYDARVRAAQGENVTPTDPTNLLGNLHGDSNIGPTEMEFNVQLPSCHTMKDKDRHQRLHCDTTYSNIQVHHWIKVSKTVLTADDDFNSNKPLDRHASFKARPK